MKISTKIIISFVFIAAMPIVFIFGLCVGFGNYQIAELEEKYDIEVQGFEKLYNSIGILNQITDNVRDDVKDEIKKDVTRFEDRKFLEGYNKVINEKYTFIMVKKSDIITYNGAYESPDVIDRVINPLLYRDSDDMDGMTVYLSDTAQYLVKPVNFQYIDGEKGAVYIVSRINNSLPEIREMIEKMVILVSVCIIGVAFFLTWWIYRGILQPVNELKKAAENIANGNLDFHIEQYKNNEFGELSEAFEEMRSHLKESIEENIKNDEESKELISNISHDLKTPLTTIKGYVEGIMDGVADTPEKMNKYIKTIYNKANDMDRLIGELTIFSRIDANKIPYNFVKLNVYEYFSDCIDDINIDLSASGIQLTYINYVDKNVTVLADPEQLRRVINNIISNAVKYTDKSESFVAIRVTDKREEGFVHIEIEDNGRGIEASELPLIFDRFYRTDSSRNSSQGGSGIGLAIAKKIIEAHGGRIWATSQKGCGTTMQFILRKIQ